MSSSDTVRFICASCGYRARIPASFSGKVILCPGCQKTQIASPDDGTATGGTVSHARVSTAPEAATGQASVADAQGKIRFTCAKCGFHAKLTASYAGKAIACPGCQTAQLIPPLGEAHSSAGDAATPAVPPAAASRVSSASSSDPADEPGITVDDPDPFGEHALAGEASAAAATPKKAAAAAEKPPVADADAAEKPAPAEKPMSKPKRSVDATPAAVPGKGVVRRGGRAGAALAAEEEAAAIAEEDAAIEAEEEELAKPKELPAFLKPAAPYLERLREPKVLMVVCAGVVALILQISLIWVWRSAANSLDKLRHDDEVTTKQLAEVKDKLDHTEYELGAQISKTKDASDKLQLAQTALADSQKTGDDLRAKAKQSEADHQKEYDARKATETKLDATLEKLAKAVAARDEDYKKRVDAEKARDEEAKLRKELKDKLDELAKSAK